MAWAKLPKISITARRGSRGEYTGSLHRRRMTARKADIGVSPKSLLIRWARPAKDGLWEVGCDLRYWLLAGNLMYVEFIKDIDSLEAGQTFAKIYTSGGQGQELLSPMNAEIRELNTKANDVMAELVKDHLSEGWLLWLAKVFSLGKQ